MDITNKRQSHISIKHDIDRRTKRRRLVTLIVVVFIAIISFLAGSRYSRKTYINPGQGATSAASSNSDQRSGIPPDSLGQAAGK